MKATFHCSTLEQASEAFRFAFKERVTCDAEVIVDLGAFAKGGFVPVELPSIGLKDDTVDALLPMSFFGAMGTKYLNDANKGKGLAFRRAGRTMGKTRVGTLTRIENGDTCLLAVVDDGKTMHRYFLPFGDYDFLFLE